MKASDKGIIDELRRRLSSDVQLMLSSCSSMVRGLGATQTMIPILI